ncbi:ras association domain-containing protein 8-like [Antedon mediterranea]|uniref:ras association domain-containing protein 8-like n=1 Tax=Antedon mediterranea TaxID=105859 RepID=UPI003AF621E7
MKMGELRVWVDGLQRIVSGINDKTTCQEVIIALAQFKRQTGRYALAEKSPSHERLLEPHESPLRIMSRWSRGSNRFIMKRTGDVDQLNENKTYEGKPTRFCEKHRSMEFLPRPKETTVKRGNTFSGSWNTQVLSKKETVPSSHKASALDIEELWNLVRKQENILEEQYDDMEDIDIDIEELLQYEMDPATIEEIEDQIMLYEQTLIKNESRLEEEEFWEDELEMEEAEKEELIDELDKTKSQIIDCDKEINANNQELKRLMKLIKVEKDITDRKKEKYERKMLEEKKELQEELEEQEFESMEYEQELEELSDNLKMIEVEMQRKLEEELKLLKELEEIEELEKQKAAAEVEQKKAAIVETAAIPIKQSKPNRIELFRGGVLRRLKGSPRELSISQDEPEGVFV